MRYKLPLNKIIVPFIIIFAFPVIKTFGNANKQGIRAYLPKYLMVKDFNKCFSIKYKGDFQYYCLPANKPKLCPTDSWKQLAKMGLPPC